MKTRNGFVSNSSSSSFIIGILKPDYQCQDCGIASIDYLLNRRFSGYLITNGIDDLIEDEERAIKDRDRYAKNVKHIPSWSSCITLQEYKQQQEEYNIESEERIEELVNMKIKYGNMLKQLKISYHDTTGNQFIKTLNTRGVIEILEKRE